MLKKLSRGRTFRDNLKLGTLTAFSAGMVNVTSVVIFFSFTSNVTGHYAILAQEISKGNWYQAAVVFAWIGFFFLGNFTSNILLIHTKGGRYPVHTFPLLLEILCIVFTGIYLQVYYMETLKETELLVALMLFAMGLQNGLTASISNSVVKTTHLTGITTDLGVLFGLFTKMENRQDPELVQKAKLLLAILIAYMAGGVFAGSAFIKIQNNVFFLVGLVLLIIALYELYKYRYPLGYKEPSIAGQLVQGEGEERLFEKIGSSRKSA